PVSVTTVADSTVPAAAKTSRRRSLVTENGRPPMKSFCAMARLLATSSAESARPRSRKKRRRRGLVSSGSRLSRRARQRDCTPEAARASCAHGATAMTVFDGYRLPDELVALRAEVRGPLGPQRDQDVHLPRPRGGVGRRLRAHRSREGPRGDLLLHHRAGDAWLHRAPDPDDSHRRDSERGRARGLHGTRREPRGAGGAWSVALPRPPHAPPPPLLRPQPRRRSARAPHGERPCQAALHGRRPPGPAPRDPRA